MKREDEAPSVAKLDELMLDIAQEIRVDASLEATFAAILDEMGPHNADRSGAPMPMTLEARPGGRWYRDLGNDDGHLWGHVQAIKRPTLLEITGPMFMSYPVAANIQYRLSSVDGQTVITFRHSAFGLVAEEHRVGLRIGWSMKLERVRANAEGNRV